MILNEIFDRPQKFFLSNPYAPHFRINDREYVVQFQLEEKLKGAVMVSFGLVDDEEPPETPDTIPLKFGMTSTGDEVKVMSTVLAIIRNFMQRNPDIKIMRFTATHKEPSRMRLYDRMVKNLSQGWIYGVMDTEAGNRVYTLVKSEDA